MHEPSRPAANTQADELVKAGGWSTTMVSFWSTPPWSKRLAAFRVIVNGPAWVGVPEIVAVPLLPSVAKVSPGASVPAMRAMATAGRPVAVTVKEPGWPSVKVAVVPLVNTGGPKTWSSTKATPGVDPGLVAESTTAQ